MALGRSAFVLALCAGVLGAACGFSETGALEGSGNGGPGAASGNGSDTGAVGAAPGADGAAPATDGSSPVGVPVCSPPSCSVPTTAAGWELVLYGTSRADACPAGFDAADLVESPAAAASACACAACATTGTNCNTGAIPTAYDSGGGACGTSGTQHQTNGGACRAQSGNFGQDARVDAPTAVAGTCSSASSPVAANVLSEQRRLCTRQASTCGGGACGAPPSMTACLAAAGDVACLSGTKHVLGSSVVSCGCTITSATCGGKLAFYPSSACGGTPVTLNVGVCTATGSASFVSTKWTGTVASETCATTPGAPTLTLETKQTVCCP
jgi:hypothetical protein